MCLALVRPHLGYRILLWVPQDERDMDMTERVQQRATKMMKELHHLSCKERLRALWLFSLKQTAQRGSYQCVQIPAGRVQRRQNSLFSGAHFQDHRQWAQTETQEVPSEQQKTLFLSALRVTEC